MLLRIAVVLFLSQLIRCQDGPNTTCTVLNDINGCSTPLRLPFPYKTQFTPACNLHDVCYRCGKMYGWTQSDCDKGFLNKMKSTCKNATLLSFNLDTPSVQFIGISYWEFLKRIREGWKKMTENSTSKEETQRIWKECLELASMFRRWLSVSEPVEKCEKGAELYHRSVQTLGILFYRHSGIKDFCKEKCAKKFGDPNV